MPESLQCADSLCKSFYEKKRERERERERMLCPENILLYLLGVYGEYRRDVFVQNNSVYVFRKEASKYGLNVSRFHYNYGLEVLDREGGLMSHPCFQVRSESPMAEVLRIGTRYYKRGSKREVREGGDFGCWFLNQGGTGVFLNTTGMIHTSRVALWHATHPDSPEKALRDAVFDRVYWCKVARSLRVTGFVFDKEIVHCDCGPSTSSSCVPVGLKTGWDASLACNCTASEKVLRCA